MNDRGEQLCRRPADPPRRAVGGDQLGELCLDGLEIANEPVVVVVGDLGLVQHVIAVGVMVDVLPKLLGSLASFG